jgi:hypothetical protein
MVGIDPVKKEGDPPGAFTGWARMTKFKIQPFYEASLPLVDHPTGTNCSPTKTSRDLVLTGTSNCLEINRTYPGRLK